MCFWEENHEGTVEAIKRSCLIVEGRKEREDGVFDFVPEFSKENWSKSVRSRAGVGVHGEKGLLNFIVREWVCKITQLR